MNISKFVGIGVGEIHTTIGWAEAETKIVNVTYRAPTEKRVLQQIFREVDKLKDYEGIGVAIPGLLHPNKGIMHKARNLGIKNLPIAEILEKRYKVPVYVSNLSVACALGEKLFGAAKGYKDIVYVLLSAGIEAGVIMDDRVVIGKNGDAHEIGHTVIDASSDVICGCGRKGHWEAFCSTGGIPTFAKHLLDTKYAGKDSALRKVKDLDMYKIFKLAKKDKTAKAVVAEIGRLNTIGMANITEIYDPQIIVLGGTLPMELEGQVLNPILRGIGKYTARLNKAPKIVITSLGKKAVLYGAVVDFL
jgi:glucokinase